jgi:hypothetical protein
MQQHAAGGKTARHHSGLYRILPFTYITYQNTIFTGIILHSYGSRNKDGKQAETLPSLRIWAFRWRALPDLQALQLLDTMRIGETGPAYNIIRGRKDNVHDRENRLFRRKQKPVLFRLYHIERHRKMWIFTGLWSKIAKKNHEGRSSGLQENPYVDGKTLLKN